MMSFTKVELADVPDGPAKRDTLDRIEDRYIALANLMNEPSRRTARGAPLDRLDAQLADAAKKIHADVAKDISDLRHLHNLPEPQPEPPQRTRDHDRKR